MPTEGILLPGHPESNSGSRVLSPYRDENELTRGIYEYADLGERIFSILHRRVRTGEQRVLVVGPGRGMLLYDLIAEFGEAIDLHSIGLENLLFTPDGFFDLIQAANMWNNVSGADVKVPELSFEKVRALVSRMEAGFRVEDVVELPYRTDTFDVVIFAQEIMQYVIRKDHAINELLRVLKPKGDGFGQLRRMYYDDGETVVRLPEVIRELWDIPIRIIRYEDFHLRKPSTNCKFPFTYGSHKAYGNEFHKQGYEIVLRSVHD